MQRVFSGLGAAAVAAVIVTGCSTSDKAPAHNMDTMPAPTSAVAVLSPTEGHEVYGIITFTQDTNGVRVSADIHGLTPGKHGFHIHQYGDCSAPDGTSAGGHFSPMGMKHGAPTDAERHEGDLGNITADSAGVAAYDWVDSRLSFTGPYSIIGRGVIVHADEDDLTSQPTGAAGGRVACGVIGVAK
jgi:Cu-Zn family superoxide dismutase